MLTSKRIAKNAYCSRDIYLQFTKYLRSVILPSIIQIYARRRVSLGTFSIGFFHGKLQTANRKPQNVTWSRPCGHGCSLQFTFEPQEGLPQPRSQGPLSASRKYPGCDWSRVYVYKSNPHRGCILDLILSTLSMGVKVALLFISWKLSKLCFRDLAWPVLQSFLSKLLWVWDVDWEGILFILTTVLNKRLQPASNSSFSQHKSYITVKLFNLMRS